MGAAYSPVCAPPMLRSPITPESIASLPPFSPAGSSSVCGSDDGSSVVSSVSAQTKKFKIPDMWRPSIMDCIEASTEEEQQQALIPTVRNEIVRDLVTHMFSFNPKPQKDFCTKVAQMLVKKYCFMADKGQKVSGYVSNYKFKSYKHIS